MAAIAASLLIFGGVVALVSHQLRSLWRAQVLQREGEVLQAVAVMQREVVAHTAAELGLPSEGEALEVALHTAMLRGVLAVRLFDRAGAFVDSVPVEVEEAALPPADLAAMAGGKPLVRFHPRLELVSLFLRRASEGTAPLLEVDVPLPAPGEHDGVGVVVQYWIDGSGVAAEFARVDRRIAVQAGAAFLAGGLLIAASLVWAFRRLAQANRLLRAHAEDLDRANRELAQSARTSAIGAITAHLMHGLRNPLAGLEGFVAVQSAGAEAGAQGEWASARESTRRLRALVNEVQAVLADVRTEADFAVSSGEMCAGVRERVQPVLARHGVTLEVEGPAGVALGAREAGLGGLVLANLVQNAVEASPRGGRVRLAVAADDGAVFTVSDAGPGLPAEVRDDPFRPRRSTKPDGAGIGLAISHELAGHAGGSLALVKTGAGGTSFSLRLPTPAAGGRHHDL